MPIDIRFIVNVYPSTIPPGASGLELNGLLLTRNNVIPNGGEYGGMMQFATAADVASYFGTLSDEYAFAMKYFAGATINVRRPRRLFIGGFPDTAQNAWIRGGSIRPPLLSDFTTITSGDLTIDFSGTEVAITPVNLSTATSFSEIAGIVQAAIRETGGSEEISNASVEWIPSSYAFEIRGGGTGTDGQVISGAAGTLADAMRVTDAALSMSSHGLSAQNSKAVLNNIKARTQNWATFTSLWKATTEEKVAFAEWQASFPNYFMYVAHDDDSNLTVPGNTNNDASILSGIDVDACFVYGGFMYAAFIMGVAASIDYTGANTVITYAHRAQEGLAYNVDNTTDAQALEDKGVNFYGNYALRNDEFHFLFPGRTLGGYRWIDHYVNSIWFFSALETAAAHGLHYAPRIPYNDAGLALIRAFYQTAISNAIQNGTIDRGVELSETQKAILIQQAGEDITAEMYRNGYYLSVRQPDPTVRVNRGSTDNRLWYTYGGSVHRLDLGATSLT